MKKNNKLELNMNSYYSLQNITEVILELGYGEFSYQDLIDVINKLFTDLTDTEKEVFKNKILKIIEIINEEV